MGDLKNAKVLGLDSLLGKVKNRVWRVGVELEGGWPADSDVRVIGDASVFAGTSGGLATVMRDQNITKKGETLSPVMVPFQLAVWMKKSYPRLSDHTCGLHVHMSFEDTRYYSALMVPEYPKTLNEYLSRWAGEERLPVSHPIWTRLEGNHQYCSAQFWADSQAAQTKKMYNHDVEGTRYTSVNFCHGLHKTLECRVLPMMATPELGIRAVQRVIAITNACLVVLTKKQEKVKIEVAGQGAIVEEDISVMGGSR